MASVACAVELRCRGDEAAAQLVSPAGLLCFPGLAPPSGDAPGLADHDFEFPYLGARRQATALQVDHFADGGERQVLVRGSGALLSYTARWILDDRLDGSRGSVTFEYELSDALVTEAMNELRSRSPLPFRSDADAILRLAVGEAFEMYFERVLTAYADAARDRLGASA